MLEESDEKVQPEQKRYLKMVLESGRALNGLVNQLLDFSEIKAGKFKLQKQAFSIPDLLEQIFPILEQLRGDKPVQLVNRVSQETPMVFGDRARVQQILLNLLGNAVKFTEAGEVTLSAAEKGAVVEFAIGDTGIGIAPEMIDVIFQEFLQADGSTRRKYGGTGLGLAIVKQLVTLHGGEVWAESEPGAGSVFYFTLPKATP